MAAVKNGLLSIHRLKRNLDDSHAREIITLKMEIQEIMKGETIRYPILSSGYSTLLLQVSKILVEWLSYEEKQGYSHSSFSLLQVQHLLLCCKIRVTYSSKIE